MRSSIEPGLGTSSLRRTSPKGTTQPLLGAGVPLGNFQHGPDLIEVARFAARNWPPGANSRRTAQCLAILAAKKSNHFARRFGVKSPSSHSMSSEAVAKEDEAIQVSASKLARTHGRDSGSWPSR
jgi:hypothetical protein